MSPLARNLVELRAWANAARPVGQQALRVRESLRWMAFILISGRDV